ncbi:cytidylate kinase [Shouchella rhizosphaerae]|nr:cytidylate kinase [Shouchella rhizosphaerae]
MLAIYANYEIIKRKIREVNVRIEKSAALSYRKKENAGKCCELMAKGFNVAIDGPAGAGKSTVAKKTAEKLGFLYIDTGAMYRAITFAALAEGIDLHDGKALGKLLEKSELRLESSNEGTAVFWNGADITAAIRTNEVNSNVSLVASHREVREGMTAMQQELAKSKNAVLDGRDIGTHVLPDANVKVFLTASVEERARRRHLEQLEKGLPSDFEQLKKDIAKRDELDSTRAIAPLKQAADAQVVDTTSMGIDEVVETILDLVKEHSRQ